MRLYGKGDRGGERPAFAKLRANFRQRFSLDPPRLSCQYSGDYRAERGILVHRAPVIASLNKYEAVGDHAAETAYSARHSCKSPPFVFVRIVGIDSCDIDGSVIASKNVKLAV